MYKKLKKNHSILIICVLKCNGLLTKAHAAIGQGRWGWGGGNLVAFFNICYRHIHHILIFQTSGDTWPAAFYSIWNLHPVTFLAVSNEFG